MAFPPPTLSTSRTNATPQQDNHPADHNALALAINDIVPILTPFSMRRGVGLSESSQAIAGGAQVAFSWSTEQYDTHSYHGSGSSTITIPSGLSGLYAVTLRVGVGGTGIITEVCDIVLNLDGTLYQTPILAGKTGGVISAIVPMGVGEVIEGRVYNGMVGPQFFNASIHLNYLRPI